MSEVIVIQNNIPENQPTTPPTITLMLKKCRDKEPKPVDIQKEMKRRGVLPGTIVSAPWRHKANGVYDNRACNPNEYERNYYHTKVKGHFVCDRCGCEFTAKKSMLLHQAKGTTCVRIQELKKLLAFQESSEELRDL